MTTRELVLTAKANRLSLSPKPPLQIQEGTWDKLLWKIKLSLTLHTLYKFLTTDYYLRRITYVRSSLCW